MSASTGTISLVWFLTSVAVALTACDAVLGDAGPTTDAAPAEVDGAPMMEAGPDAADPVPDAAPPPPDARLPCDVGDQRIENTDTGSCYMLFVAPLSWLDGEAACAALGGHLAAVGSLEENAFLSLIAPSTDVWIGATDVALEDTFAWSSGDPFVFEHWREGEPNDGDDNGEDCAVIEGQNNLPGEGCLWDDRACAGRRPYLCERP